MTQKEKVDELYQEYLKGKLDLVFNGADGDVQNNTFYSLRNEIFDYSQIYSVIRENGKYNFINGEKKLLFEEWFDYADDFINCYARVGRNGKYNFINGEGKIISNEWFDAVNNFENGYALVGRNGKCNFINGEGRPISSEWFDEARDFEGGYAIIKKNDKYNFINGEGKLISSEWFDDARDFEGGYAIIEKNGKYSFINGEGRPISSEWFDNVFCFVNGYARVEKNGKYNFINGEGRPISSKWFEDASPFKNGYAVVKKNGKYNFINGEGKLISEEWFVKAWSFENGHARIKKDNGYYYINIEGKIVSEEWWGGYSDFKNNYAIVRDVDSRKFNFIAYGGRIVSPEWFDGVWNFTIYGYAVVKKNGKYNFINGEGKLISNEWFDDAFDFKNGYGTVQKGNKSSIIDGKGNLLIPFIDTFKSFEVLHNFIVIKKRYSDDYYVREIDLGGCKVKKGLLGYQCAFLNDKFKLKYQPIKRYGVRYYLCHDRENVYLYDRFGNSYGLLGTVYDITYDDNFIIDKKRINVYLMYNDKILNVTEYYKNNLMHKGKISISKGINDILTREDFSFLNMSKIDEIMVEERKKNVEIALAQEKAKKIKDLEAKKKEDELREEEIRKAELEAIKQIQEGIKKLQSISSRRGKKIRIKLDDIFDVVGTHKEIKPILIEMLRFIDLVFFKFDNVQVEGIDFRGSNIIMGNGFDPQKVYGKSLRNCNFEGLYLSYSVNFSGVDIRGCKFGNDDDHMTLDRMPKSFKDAIYDETTTYNGQPITEILEGEKKNGK